MKRRTKNRAIVLIAAMVVVVAASTQLKADTGMCGSGTTTLRSPMCLRATCFSAQ